MLPQMAWTRASRRVRFLSLFLFFRCLALLTVAFSGAFDFGSSPKLDFDFSAERVVHYHDPSFDFVDLSDEVRNMSLGSPLVFGGGLVGSPYAAAAAAAAAPDQGQWDIADLLEQNSPLLTELHVLPYDSLVTVAMLLPGNTMLESLDCSLSTPDEFTAVAAALARTGPTLKTLSIDWPRLVLNYRERMEKAEQALASSLLANAGIVTLKTRSSNPIFNAIAANKRLQRVTVETGSSGNVATLATATHLRYLRIGWGQSASLNDFVDVLITNARDHALEELDLCSPGGSYSGEAMSRFLQISSRIKSLWLRGKYDMPNDIARGVLSNISLTSLSIHGLNSDPTCTRDALCKAISGHPCLKTVDLRNVFQINAGNLLDLVQTPQLTVLRVVGCMLWNDGDHPRNWEKVCIAVREKGRLEELDISANHFPPTVAAQVLVNVPPVARLMLGKCVLADDGLAALAVGLKGHTAIQAIDLSQGKGDLTAVLASLSELSNLRSLNLSDIHCQPTYMREPFVPTSPFGMPCGALVTMLHHGLRRLDFSSCFNFHGVVELLRTLSLPGMRLRYLDLSSMQVDEAVVVELCRMIVHNKSIETLRLCNVAFAADHVERIAVSIGQNRTITSFSCYGYGTSTPQEGKAVDEALCANLARSVVQELEIGSRTSGFSRVLLRAIDESHHLHHVHVVGPENFEADYLLDARQRLRWKENAARVQGNCVRDAINTWLLMAKRDSLVRMIGKDMRHMIAGYIWRLRMVWPLPQPPMRDYSVLDGNAFVAERSELDASLFSKEPEVVEQRPQEPAKAQPVRRMVHVKGKPRRKEAEKRDANIARDE